MWLKELPLTGSPATLDLSQTEIALPRQPRHSLGSQDAPGLAAGLINGSSALAAAWQDRGISPNGAQDIIAELIPLPVLRKANP